MRDEHRLPLTPSGGELRLTTTADLSTPRSLACELSEWVSSQLVNIPLYNGDYLFAKLL